MKKAFVLVISALLINSFFACKQPSSGGGGGTAPSGGDEVFVKYTDGTAEIQMEGLPKSLPLSKAGTAQDAFKNLGLKSDTAYEKESAKKNDVGNLYKVVDMNKLYKNSKTSEGAYEPAAKLQKNETVWVHLTNKTTVNIRLHKNLTTLLGSYDNQELPIIKVSQAPKAITPILEADPNVTVTTEESVTVLEIAGKKYSLDTENIYTAGGVAAPLADGMLTQNQTLFYKLTDYNYSVAVKYTDGTAEISMEELPKNIPLLNESNNVAQVFTALSAANCKANTAYKKIIADGDKIGNLYKIADTAKLYKANDTSATNEITSVDKNTGTIWIKLTNKTKVNIFLCSGVGPNIKEYTGKDIPAIMLSQTPLAVMPILEADSEVTVTHEGSVTVLEIAGKKYSLDTERVYGGQAFGNIISGQPGLIPDSNNLYYRLTKYNYSVAVKYTDGTAEISMEELPKNIPLLNDTNTVAQVFTALSTANCKANIAYKKIIADGDKIGNLYKIAENKLYKANDTSATNEITSVDKNTGTIWIKLTNKTTVNIRLRGGKSADATNKELPIIKVSQVLAVLKDATAVKGALTTLFPTLGVTDPRVEGDKTIVTIGTENFLLDQKVYNGALFGVALDPKLIIATNRDLFFKLTKQ